MGAGLFSIPGMMFSAQTQARSTVIEFFSKLRLHEIQRYKAINTILLHQHRFLLVCDGGIHVTITGCSPDVGL